MRHIMIFLAAVMLSASALAGSISTSVSLISSQGSSAGTMSGTTTINESGSGSRDLHTPTSTRSSSYDRTMNSTTDYGNTNDSWYESVGIAVNGTKVGAQTAYTQSVSTVSEGYRDTRSRVHESGTYLTTDSVDLNDVVAFDQAGFEVEVDPDTTIASVDVTPTFHEQTSRERGTYTYTDLYNSNSTNASLTSVSTVSQSAYDIY